MKHAFALILILFLFVNPALAHQPRIIEDRPVFIKNPEISQAFYARLQGVPDQYLITSEEDFILFVNLFVPDLPGIRKDFTIDVCRITDDGEKVRLFELSGDNHHWQQFYEPFAGDRYYRGPEKEKKVPAGKYAIMVSNPENSGKYVLSVGSKEHYTLREAFDTVARLPEVKTYFDKSPWTAYFNLIGLFIVLGFLLIITASWGVYRLILWLVKKQSPA